MSKTIFLIRNVTPSSYGGAETYQLELAEVLRHNGYKPIIVTSSEKLQENARANKFTVINAPYFKQQNWSGWRNILLPIYMLKQIKLRKWYKQQIEKYQPVALDIQSRDDWIAASLAGKDTGVKVFWTDHIDFRTWVLQNLNEKYKNLIGKHILKIAKDVDKIIMISDFEAKYFRTVAASYNLQNIVVIKNGVIDQKSLYEDEPIENNFCYVGRIVKYKGVGELIEAFNIFSDKNKTMTLDLYGTGPDFEKYQQLAEKNPRIIFHGFTDEPLEAIARSKFFVLPSYYEGLSMSLLQAAMLGKVPIATKEDGNPEIVEDHKTGLLVKSRSVNSLARAMFELVENEAASKQMSINLHKKYEQEIEFEKTIQEKFIPLIEE